MGTVGTEVAREASDIILMTDDFTSIVNAIKWGRTVSTSVRKYVQHQLSVNITAVILTFVSAITSADNLSVLTAVQLLWVNLVLNTCAALGLATDKPDVNILKRPPMGRNSPLISTSMWKMIMGQTVLQLIICFILHFAGQNLYLNENPTNRQKDQLDALVFNTFVWLQVFKLIANRKLDEGDGLTTIRERLTAMNLNFFQGFFTNWYFVILWIIICALQTVIMFVGGASFSIVHQTGAMWATAILCGVLSLPVVYEI
ncbi:unnamed protein product [Ambrosiozyma monospora]|uniref:Unnamed protein product n=1 Tax=Ambrosiozyma monospora TaxID=43982 RepID=A0ACB5TYC0_AMBMO|nr:unnamed protein product [Ambrosiozyma monospora]